MTKDERLEQACQAFAEELADYFRPEWLELCQQDKDEESTLAQYILTYLVPAPEEWILGMVAKHLPKE